MAESVYKVIELVGTSTESWENAAAAAVETASKTLRDLRVAEIAKLDMQIEDGRTVVTSPHKVYGPETNDLVLQLRKRGIDKVFLGGMSANLCTESHMRELIEQGFDVTVISDATAAAQNELGDGYASAMVNFRFIANGVVTTEEAIQALTGGMR